MSDIPSHLLDPALFEPPPTCTQCGTRMFSGLVPSALCNKCEREQLSMAAKAAGKARAEWDWVWLQERGENVARDMLWDPRRDSGQAFELGILLDISVGENGDMVAEYVDGGRIIDDIKEPFIYGNHADQLRAARLAIFRAVVAIGRAMP